MKKLIFLSAFIFLSMITFSQAYNLYVSGHVYELNSPNGIPNHEVFVQTDTTNPGGGIFAVFVTDPSGSYFGEIDLNGLPPQGFVTVFTYDCNQQIQSYYLPYFPGAAVTADFYICTEPNPGDCTNSFLYYNNPGQSTFYFTGEVYPPASANYYWEFGDGSTGEGQQTEHVYNPGGNQYFTVTLTTISYDSMLNDTCFATSTQEVWVGGSGNDCYNWFDFQTNDFLTYSFAGYAYPDSVNTQYYWDFGDGNTSGGQVATHTFTQGGVAFYNVCLYTYSYTPSGDSCSAVSCQQVPVGNQGGDCQNMFWYVNTGNLSFNFQGESMPAPAQYYFWDFGDGITATGQTINHTFPENAGDVFLVTLQTVSMDPATGDTCVAYSYQEVWINQGGDCQNFFWYENSGNLTFNFHGESLPMPAQQYVWDFGDGSFAYEPDVTHTFEGTFNVYNVCLTTYIFANPGGGDSCSFTSCQEVYMNNSGGCDSWFEYTANGLEVTFFGQTNSQLPTSYNWIVENGIIGTGQQFTYTFPETGTYLVTLYTVDSSSCESWYNMEVTVEGGGQGSVLSGTVYMDSIPADYGMAGLFGIGNNGTFTFSMASLVNGGYFFENVPQGQYYLVAGLSPQSAQFFNFFPTYYGDVLFWLNATIIELGEPQNPYNIHLVPTSFIFAGPGNISGNVYAGSFKSGGESGVTVMLMNEAGIPVGYKTTDENGHYEFSNMNFGTYKVSVEMPGMNSETATVSLTESSSYSEVNFVVDQNQVYLSLNESSQAAELLRVYPNPATENINIELNSNGVNPFNVKIFNHIGQIVLSENKTATDGFNAILLQIESLPDGLYTLRAQSDKGLLFTTKFLKSR